MPGRKRKYEVDPDDLDKAARKLRQLAVRDFHASDDFAKGLTERAGADHVFGNSPAAKDIAVKWDQAVTRRVDGADDLGKRTQELAEDLERTADEYRRNDDDQRTRMDEIDREQGRP